MLSDLLSLEEFFGKSDSALFMDDLSHHYELRQLQKCLLSGELVSKRVHCGPDQGRVLIWLSQAGRKKARNIYVG